MSMPLAGTHPVRHTEAQPHLKLETQWDVDPGDALLTALINVTSSTPQPGYGKVYWGQTLTSRPAFLPWNVANPVAFSALYAFNIRSRRVSFFPSLTVLLALDSHGGSG